MELLQEDMEARWKRLLRSSIIEVAQKLSCRKYWRAGILALSAMVDAVWVLTGRAVKFSSPKKSAMASRRSKAQVRSVAAVCSRQAVGIHLACPGSEDKKAGERNAGA